MHDDVLCKWKVENRYGAHLLLSALFAVESIGFLLLFFIFKPTEFEQSVIITIHIDDTKKLINKKKYEIQR